jgi:chromosome segregation ATPase
MAKLTKAQIDNLFSALSKLDSKLDRPDLDSSIEIKSEIAAVRDEIKLVSSELQANKSEIENLTIVLGKLENRFWLFSMAILSLVTIALLGFFASWNSIDLTKF